ncbi:glutamine-hydrolyzing carbamoyl-phosphate synthase small subunit [Erythrobacter aquimaris]|uniref:Carbamoyl phosphate synthase small chain n=1 Tax=Qipengyuania aquimaris TaxID=255984 RepID=A0A6I4TIQ3_9SPHN|nr:glutamine-hydrolyzing carbamoyl-phosphate synthase small subunit [Qipengyuania aquimaris]MXO95815.1 glutamine-hydrolyzing carbamoyl-phosphate synthase small subunit [Qipengyuania aquimaris]
MALPAFSHAQPKGATGVLVFADGTCIWGKGFGASGSAVGEVCFNTAMTGYQEVMTDPSYDSQIVTFTFPHIGNVGANEEDHESRGLGAVGCIVRQEVTPQSNFRAQQEFVDWMTAHGKIGLSGVDTRALTRRIRLNGAPNAVIAHNPRGEFDMKALKKQAAEWSGLEGLDLVPGVTREGQEDWKGGHWQLGFGYTEGTADKPHVVAIDYGAKDNIFRNLVKAGAKVTVVPARTALDEVMALKPDGVFLSNGPGDPSATGEYAVPVIKGLLDADVPLFGICLGHQMLGLAAGAKTAKMFQGHRGANHPVQRVGGEWGASEGLVEITSMNHGFAVDVDTLPDGVEQTHVSLFDGTNCGISIKGKKAFGVQYHPEASPGPQDSFYLFEKFVGMLGAT